MKKSTLRYRCIKNNMIQDFGKVNVIGNFKPIKSAGTGIFVPNYNNYNWEKRFNYSNTSILVAVYKGTIGLVEICKN